MMCSGASTIQNLVLKIRLCQWQSALPYLSRVNKQAFVIHYVFRRV